MNVNNKLNISISLYLILYSFSAYGLPGQDKNLSLAQFKKHSILNPDLEDNRLRGFKLLKDDWLIILTDYATDKSADFSTKEIVTSTEIQIFKLKPGSAKICLREPVNKQIECVKWHWSETKNVFAEKSSLGVKFIETAFPNKNGKQIGLDYLSSKLVKKTNYYTFDIWGNDYKKLSSNTELEKRIYAHGFLYEGALWTYYVKNNQNSDTFIIYPKKHLSNLRRQIQEKDLRIKKIQEELQD